MWSTKSGQVSEFNVAEAIDYTSKETTINIIKNYIQIVDIFKMGAIFTVLFFKSLKFYLY